MPYRTSSEASETDALRVVEALGCRTERVEITPMVEPMLELIADGNASVPNDELNVRRGNVMARQRMIVLYDRSAAFDALVIGTSNKTEALLGYGTLHGDMAAALAPIGDLYKTQLRAVARELGVPEEVVAKPPSADLWPGQTDEGELGQSYDLLDRVLFAIVDRRWSVDRCVAAGLERSLVEWVAGRVARMSSSASGAGRQALAPHAGIDHSIPGAAPVHDARRETRRRESSPPCRRSFRRASNRPITTR